jgi:hypothetical protein
MAAEAESGQEERGHYGRVRQPPALFEPAYLCLAAADRDAQLAPRQPGSPTDAMSHSLGCFRYGGTFTRLFSLRRGRWLGEFWPVVRRPPCD